MSTLCDLVPSAPVCYPVGPNIIYREETDLLSTINSHAGTIGAFYYVSDTLPHITTFDSIEDIDRIFTEADASGALFTSGGDEKHIILIEHIENEKLKSLREKLYDFTPGNGKFHRISPAYQNGKIVRDAPEFIRSVGRKFIDTGVHKEFLEIKRLINTFKGKLMAEVERYFLEKAREVDVNVTIFLWILLIIIIIVVLTSVFFRF